MALTFDQQSGRFRNPATGRYVSEQAVRKIVDQLADGASARMAAVSERLLAGEVSLAEWQAEMQRTIKLSQLAASTIAHGGRARMDASRYGAAGAAIRLEYGFLRQFADDIASGRQPLNGSLLNRARLYGQAARSTFAREYGRDQQARGFKFERNVIRSGESCAGCRAESARGVVPVGSLVPVGSRRPCLRNCKCVIRYSREAQEAAA